MCQKCSELVRTYYPKLSLEEYNELLIGATAFPFAGPNYIEGQLKELISNTDGSLGGALEYAERRMEEEMEKYKETEGSEYGGES